MNSTEVLRKTFMSTEEKGYLITSYNKCKYKQMGKPPHRGSRTR
jgi:hypothetical protein